MAQLGNNNAAKGKSYRDSLRKSLKQFEDVDLGVKRGKALRAITDAAVKQAITGDSQDRRDIADRLDGKPAQAITGPQGEPISIVERVIVVQALDNTDDNVIEGEVVQDSIESMPTK